MQPNTGAHSDLSYKQMFTELFSYAAPYVFVGLAIPIYSYIDTNTINRAMIASGHQDISTAVLSIVTLYLPKVVMIPVSLATAFGLTLIPTITELFTARNYKLLNRQIDQTMQVILFFRAACFIWYLGIGWTGLLVFFIRLFILRLGFPFCFWYHLLHYCFLYSPLMQRFCKGSTNKNLRSSVFFVRDHY
ncbi:hypothetical protein BsIDN1_52790 [Bacillus safensis]|uniref:Polysaccharide biosynthesis protein C-terminal domain-containing protein n=1 Tax=Bacillus safensis TaxID=561879 RepID=A0A5S9MFC2_BACIA|nr:hypothetical protein BsIDN1_52790 [Bacillus safensis]